MIFLNFNDWRLQGFPQRTRLSSYCPSFCKHFEGYVKSMRKQCDFLYLNMLLARPRPHSHRLHRLSVEVVWTLQLRTWRV